MTPIFIGWTRSFWLFVAGAAMILEQGQPLILSFATLLAIVLPWSPQMITQTVMDLGPLVTFMLVLHQRGGIARPYTMDPRAVK